MQKIIEFEDKVALYHNSNIPDINKVNDTDMNEIKSVVNGSLQGTNAMGSIVVDDINCKNMCNGANLEVYLNTAVNSCGVSSGNIGLYIKVSGGSYTISTTSTQTRYRVACTSNEPSATTQTAYNGVNKDGTSDSITIDTTGYNYLIVNATDLTKIQIEKGNTATTYTPYKKIIKEENGYIKENTTFYANDFKCKNMFNKSNIVAGYLSNAGNVVSNTQYSTSDYIDVKGIENITISGSSGNSENICFYDSSKTFISFVSTGANATLTTSVPSNAYYCRITVKNTNLDLVQLEVGSEVTLYTPYVEVAPNVETIDISSYATTSVSSVSRAYIQRVGHIYRFNIVCNVSSASSTAVILFNNLPFTPAFITELNSVNGNNVTVRCFYDNGQIKISSAQASTYFINGTMII